MRRTNVFRALAAAVVLVVASQSAASANEFAMNASPIDVLVDGVKGNQGIRTDPTTVNGISYVHPTQIDIGAANGDFVAVGTYKGWGPSTCTDDFDAQWSGYVDGETGGIYFCQTFGTNQYGTGEVSSFQISYQACGPDGVKKWALVYGGTLRRCVTSAATNGVWAQVGLETVNTTVDRNIDVRHSGLYINKTTDSAWVLTSWEASGVVAPSYTVRINSQSSNDSYLAPFD